MFLNGVGSRQEALKRLLVQCWVRPGQIGPRRGHDSGGRKIIQTGTIVEHVWATRNEENGGRFGRDSRLGVPMRERFMRNGLRGGEGKWKEGAQLDVSKGRWLEANIWRIACLCLWRDAT